MAAPSLSSIIGRSSLYEYGPTSTRWVDRFLCLYWGLQAGHELGQDAADYVRIDCAAYYQSSYDGAGRDSKPVSES